MSITPSRNPPVLQCPSSFCLCRFFAASHYFHRYRDSDQGLPEPTLHLTWASSPIFFQSDWIVGVQPPPSPIYVDHPRFSSPWIYKGALYLLYPLLECHCGPLYPTPSVLRVAYPSSHFSQLFSHVSPFCVHTTEVALSASRPMSPFLSAPDSAEGNICV